MGLCLSYYIFILRFFFLPFGSYASGMGQLHHEVHVLPVGGRRIGALYGYSFLVSVMEDDEASGLIENIL